MFPEDFAERHILAYTSPGDAIYDPFSGRGTTVFQGLLMGRRAAGTDINPVAACISGAKADAPKLIETLRRIDQLEELMPATTAPPPSLFFERCFHQETLSQIMYLRAALNWRSGKVDRFIAAMALGALHGESHKSKLCFSNRMPRTISTKPDYSVRWWEKHGLEAPRRDVFAILRDLAKFRLRFGRPTLSGRVVLEDARRSSRRHRSLLGQVKLVVTSPPYLDVTDYAEDQWLRLWFLGGNPAARAGIYPDDRHTLNDSYWRFLREVWTGISPLLANDATIVVRIGGAIIKEDITDRLSESLRAGMPKFEVSLKGPAQTSALKGRQTNVFRPGTKTGVEHDFIFSVSRQCERDSALAAMAA